MKQIIAILDADADGTLHLPVPEELRQRRIKVVASLTPLSSDAGNPSARAEQVRQWAAGAKGTVLLAPGESADDLRRAYYAQKYGTEG